MARMYNAPIDGSESDIGTQINTQYYNRKALVELKKKQYFSQLADTTKMPKHYGKKIKQYHYIPLLDDSNINDQGLDATGATLTTGEWSAWDSSGDLIGTAYASETEALTAAGDGGTVAENGGNLYGSSKDVGVISAKLPALSETGGRVNRVGFTRVEIEGTIEKFGFFDEYTQESLDFDTDEELEMHIHREMLNGAGEITEDAIQIDLLNGAGVIRYCGDATEDSEITGEDGDVDEVTYDDLMRFSIDLDDNRCPKHTTIITGSRMVDTKVVDSARVLYVGSEMIPTIKTMADSFSNQAFIPVQHYADAGTVLNGEIGTIDQFRIVVVPEMMHWNGTGATETDNGGYRTTNGSYNVYPLLCVGDGSFTTIGFQTDGKSVKWKIYHKKPGEGTASTLDPYGETGFMSIKWYYGLMVLRSERLGLIKSVARV